MATISEALALAAQHHQAGQLQIAEQVYRQILAVDPNCADALHLLGIVASQVGRHDLAIEYINRAINLNPSEAAFHSNLATTYNALGNVTEAIGCLRRAIELQPLDAAIHYSLAQNLKAQGKLSEAIAFYRRALQLQPTLVEAHNDLGLALTAQGEYDQAVEVLHHALSLRPTYFQAHNNLGAVFQAQGKLDETVACCRRAVELAPNVPETHNNLGHALQSQGKPNEAIASYLRAIELKPDYAEAQWNLGYAYQQLGQFDHAMQVFTRAIELAPDSHFGHFGLALLLLLLGDWNEGWSEFEWRWRGNHERQRQFAQPRWEGEPLGDRAILLHAEQGFGDTIQFVRYAATIKKQNPTATVILETQPPLTKLLATSSGIDRLIARGDALPPFDVRSPLLSVPRLLGISVDNVPVQSPYLSADPALVAHWRERLKPLRGLRIGLNWRGKPITSQRDFPIACYRTLSDLTGIQFICLQKDATADELAIARDIGLSIIQLNDFDTTHGPFIDTAAVMLNLDLVISSDTAIPHLAGALGVPVWLLLQFVPDWRWLTDRSDTPWYSSMRLFRQKSIGDWNSVSKQLHTALSDLIAIKCR
jgi:tetratricopeptide (TPR) repeat protein